MYWKEFLLNRLARFSSYRLLILKVDLDIPQTDPPLPLNVHLRLRERLTAQSAAALRMLLASQNREPI